MKAYYQDEHVTIYHGDCREVVPELSDRADLVLTDPPYSKRTHDGARTCRNGGTPLIDFEHLRFDQLQSFLELFAAQLSGWLVTFLDWRYVASLESCCPHGLRFVRFGIWVKPNGAPQFSGDRPGMGWEAICFLHTADKRMRWNGGGRHAVWTAPRKARQWHPTQKPLSVVSELAMLFASEGDLILDPFLGSGTSLVAARAVGCRGIGIEIDERCCEYAAKRLEQKRLF